MKKFDFIVFGNNTSAMISALELSKKHSVALINPTPNWGAHFAGININGTSFDIGMNFFEFTTFHKPSHDILSYDPKARNDSARFFQMVENYISSKIEFVEVDKIEILSQGVFAGDIVMANQLDILNKLPKETTEKIKQELEAILASNTKTLHASQKKINEDLFLKTSYWDVSVANHGKTFHDLFIEPFCKTIFNISSKDFPALFHRIIWTPLFYPETLLNAIKTNEQLAPTLFHYPVKGMFSTFLNEVLKEIKENKNIVVFSKAPKQIIKSSENIFELAFEDETFSSTKLIWCNDLQSLLKLFSAKTPEFTPEKASITLAFCSTESVNITRLFSCLYVCNESPIYRITNQEYAAKDSTNPLTRLVLEFNYDVLNAKGIDTNEKINSHINSFLIKNNIIKEAIPDVSISIKAIKNAVNLPTLNNFNNFENLFNLTQNLLPEVELLGPASGFVSTSFNDQVVQALKIGKKYN